MARYEVIRPWFGVKKGDVVETEKLHPALTANVKPLDDKPKPALVVAIPKPEKAPRKAKGAE